MTVNDLIEALQATAERGEDVLEVYLAWKGDHLPLGPFIVTERYKYEDEAPTVIALTDETPTG